MKTLLSAIWFALGCTPEVLMLADTLAQYDAHHTRVELPTNDIWMVEFNTFGVNRRKQVIFWEASGKVSDWFWADDICKPCNVGSPWRFKVNDQAFTVHFEHYTETNTRHDPEQDNRRVHPKRRHLKPDR